MKTNVLSTIFTRYGKPNVNKPSNYRYPKVIMDIRNNLIMDISIPNSDIWQSLSLPDWRCKSVVTIRWMGATFSGSGLAPTEYRQRHPVCTATMRLMIMIYNAGNLYKQWPCNDMVFGFQYDFLNHNDVLIIGTYFFLRKGTRKTTTDTKMG